MLELQQLQAFLAVAEKGSFSEAAQKIHLTQPAVSKRIAALERHLGKTLFDRIGRAVLLTEAGRLLKPQAEALLSQANSIENTMDNLDNEVAGSLSIGISHHIGLHRLPPVLKKYCQCYPNVELDISFIDSEHAYEAVQSGKMEIGLVTLPEKNNSPITTQLIWSDALLFVSNDAHPLQKFSKPTLEDLSKYPAILPNQNTFTRRIIENAFAEYHSPLSVAIETNYLETNRMLISIGLGWGVIPASMCDQSVSPIPITSKPLQRYLGYVIHPERQPSNAARALIHLLEEERTQLN